MALEEFVKTFDPERRARINAMADCLLAGNQTLKDLRKGKEPPSEQIAQALNIQQAILVHQERMAEELDIPLEALTKYMQRSDVLLFLLQTYIHALDGKLMVKIPYKRAVTLEEFNKPKDSDAMFVRHVQPYKQLDQPQTRNEQQHISFTIQSIPTVEVTTVGIDKAYRIASGNKLPPSPPRKIQKKGIRGRVTGRLRSSAKSKSPG